MLVVKFCDEVLRSFGINNLVAFRQPCVLTQISNYLPLLKRTRNNRTGQDRTGQDRTGQDRTGQDRTGQDRTGQDRTGQDRTGQDRTGQDCKGNDRIEQTRTDLDSTGRGKIRRTVNSTAHMDRAHSGRYRTAQGIQDKMEEERA